MIVFSLKLMMGTVHMASNLNSNVSHSKKHWKPFCQMIHQVSSVIIKVYKFFLGGGETLYISAYKGILKSTEHN